MRNQDEETAFHIAVAQKWEEKQDMHLVFQFPSLHIDNTPTFLPPACGTQGDALRLYRDTPCAIENICSAPGLNCFLSKI